MKSVHISAPTNRVQNTDNGLGGIFRHYMDHIRPSKFGRMFSRHGVEVILASQEIADIVKNDMEKRGFIVIISSEKVSV